VEEDEVSLPRLIEKVENKRLEHLRSCKDSEERVFSLVCDITINIKMRRSMGHRRGR